MSKSSTTSLLPMLLVSLATSLLHRHTVFAEGEEDCFNVCGDHIRWGYDCARREGCFQKQKTSQEAFEACYEDCNLGAGICEAMCLENYDRLKASCDKKCEDASLLDVFCIGECLKDDFMAEFANELPDLTSQDTGIFQGIPFLGDNDEDEGKAAEDDDNEAELEPGDEDDEGSDMMID